MGGEGGCRRRGRVVGGAVVVAVAVAVMLGVMLAVAVAAMGTIVAMVPTYVS